MKKFLLPIVAAVSFCNAASAGITELKTAAEADAKETVHPGGGQGRPFWNNCAERFLYAPALDFKSVPGAVKYRFRLIDDLNLAFEFTADTPTAPLSPVWEKLHAPGFTRVVCEGVDADGKVLGEAGAREFFKVPSFKPGAYPPADRTYGEAARIGADYIFSRWYVQDLVRNGTANPEYDLNAYPSKMNAALITAMLAYAEVRPDRRAEALAVARASADYIISICQPKGTPLEYLPPTYLGTKCTAGKYAGQNMMSYPAEVGAALVGLAETTGEKKYIEAAERIASTYLRLQGEDGTWTLKLREKDGGAVCDNRLVPVGVSVFLEKLYGVTKKNAYRAAADRAFAYIEREILPSWNWEGQFEDVAPQPRYWNLTKHDACSFAIYVLKRFPGDRKWIDLSREILRFAEDQFVCWERPARADGFGARNRSPDHPFNDTGNYSEWTEFPCVLEQYSWYVPCAPSSAKLIRHYLAQYDAEKNPLDLAKARALGDAYTRAQRPDGRIPTQWTVGLEANEQQDWLNCMCADVEAIALLAEYDAIDRRVPVVPQPREWKPSGKVVAKVDAAKALYSLVKDDALGAEGYTLTIGADGSLAATAATERGLANARHTVDQLAAAKGPVPTGTMRDRPKYRVRGVMLDVGRKFMRMETLRAMAKDLAHYKMNLFHIHLNDDGAGPFLGEDGYSAFRLECESLPGLTAKDGHYTKAEFRAFVKECAAMGVTVVPEIDTPAHSGCFIRLNPAFKGPYNGATHLVLDRPEVRDTIEKVFAEYLDGPDPVFAGRYVHVGTDEYDKREAENFRAYTDWALKMVRRHGHEPCAWGSLDHAAGTTPVVADRNIVMDIWHNPYYDPENALKAGYSIVAIPDFNLYIVPAAGYYFDYLELPGIFKDWEPCVMADKRIDPATPGLLGGKFAIWNDIVGNGISEDDVVDRFLDALPTLSEKMWTGAVDGLDWEAFQVLAAGAGEAPGVNLADRPTGPDGMTGPDDTAIGWRGTGAYEVSFDLVFDDASKDLVIFDDGTSQVKIFKGGRIGFSRDGYDWSAPCDLPVKAPVHLVFRGTHNRVEIFADGRRIGDARDLGRRYKNAQGKDKFAPVVRTLHFPLVRVPTPGVRVWNVTARGM